MGRALPDILAGNQGLGLYFSPITSPSREVGLDCNRGTVPCLKMSEI
jgi:hypothetical protein